MLSDHKVTYLQGRFVHLHKMSCRVQRFVYFGQIYFISKKEKLQLINIIGSKFTKSAEATLIRCNSKYLLSLILSYIDFSVKLFLLYLKRFKREACGLKNFK